MGWDVFTGAFVAVLTAIVPIMNPLGCALILPELMAGMLPAERAAVIRSIAAYSLASLVGAMWLGPLVMGWLGIGQPALRVAGGALVVAHSWRLLEALSSKDADSGSDCRIGAPSTGALMPLTIPFTVGPGTMIAAMGIGTAVPHAAFEFVLYTSGATLGAVVLAMTVGALYGAPHGTRLRAPAARSRYGDHPWRPQGSAALIQAWTSAVARRPAR